MTAIRDESPGEVAAGDATRLPHAYPCRVLLCITGLSPQVVTETLYALAVDRSPAFVPTEVRVLTTTKGAEHVRLTLLRGERPWFARLCADYGLAGIRFDESCVDVLPNAGGGPLEDIRTPADNLAAADRVTAVIRDYTADRDCALHVSLAGGRKTMSFFAGYALSLYGREQDRLSHVLVSPRFEGNQQFFYPTRESHVIFEPGPGGAPMDARDAEVVLAELPFVRMREGLSAPLLAGRARFSECVADAQASLDPPRLTLDPDGLEVRCGAERLSMSETRFALYAYLAAERVRGGGAVCWNDRGIPEGFLDWLARCAGGLSHPYRRATRALETGAPAEYFRTLRSRTNRQLVEALGEMRARPYLIHTSGRRPRTGYGLLGLRAEQIDFSDPMKDAPPR